MRNVGSLDLFLLELQLCFIITVYLSTIFLLLVCTCMWLYLPGPVDYILHVTKKQRRPGNKAIPDTSVSAIV